METLTTLRDLQSTLDNLATIHRELSALPPDLASLDARVKAAEKQICLLYTSPSPRDRQKSRMPSSA